MNILSVKVTGLFGYFNHVIPLKTKERITIIHGPNGVGKTTVLRLLQDLFSVKVHAICRVPFSKISIRYSPKGTLQVTQVVPQNERELPYIQLIYRCGKEKVEHTVNRIRVRDRRRRLPINIVERIIDHLERVGPEEWLDTITGDVLTIEEVLFRYGELLPDEFRDLTDTLPTRLRELLAETSVYLIETQRLSTRSSARKYNPRHVHTEPRERMTVEEYSDDFVSNVQQRLRESGALSTSLDRDFPRRLLETPLPRDATEDRIRHMYADQTKYRDRLMQAGLMKPEAQVPLSSGTLGEIERKVLWIYLTDVQKKLQIFDALLLRTELLKEIINSRFSYKTFTLDAEEGFMFKSDQDASMVPLRSLSSGEQHELVLAYDLLFKVKKKALVLIDEPELSLHVTWQRKFLEDVARIAELADLDFLIATHSPSIIHNRRDLMVGLGEEVSL